MANILDRYGIKEVADVTFYKINKDGTPGVPVLFLDTLKVSTIEQTAENTSARGGKGNPELIMWDYGKEITVNLEDALFSAKSLAMMYGVDTEGDDFGEISELLKTVPAGAVKEYNAEKGTATFIINEQYCTATDVVLYDAEGNKLTSAEDVAKTKYATGTIEVVGQKIDISSDKFPGTYYVIGDTYARSETTGQDEFFQFIIPKAKMQSEVTLTMEAEGDPSTFTMNMKVLRPANGEMMKLVKFKIPVVIYTGELTCYANTSGDGDIVGEFNWTIDDAGCLSLTPNLEGENAITGEVDEIFPTLKINQDFSSVRFLNTENSKVTTLGQYCFALKNLNNIIIPDSVTSIDLSAFWNCGLTSVTIPDSVTNIGENAFAGCNKLASITISDNVTNIGEGAFQYCTSLTSVTIPDSVTTIESDIFSNCSKLPSITIPDSVTSIGDSAFSKCTDLTSVTIGNRVTNIGTYAFENCASLTSITIPDSVTSIGDSAFINCTNLQSTIISNSVTNIGAYAFNNCVSLQSITIPDGVTNISSQAFAGCTSLTSVTIPNSVTNIETAAFKGCTSLTSVTIPDSVTGIGKYVFEECSNLTDIYLPGREEGSLNGAPWGAINATLHWNEEAPE